MNILYNIDMLSKKTVFREIKKLDLDLLKMKYNFRYIIFQETWEQYRDYIL